MEETSNLALPYILPSQAQKHVTHNEALRRLDAIVQLGVASRTGVTPPESPDEGERHIVAASATGAWAGQDRTIAAWQDGAWAFYAPQPGWVAVVLDENVLCYWSGTQWNEIQGGDNGSGTGGPTTPVGTSFQNIPLAGFGTEADAANPFAAKLNNALWTARTEAEGGTGDLRYTMNKEGGEDTLSLVMQTGFSGRAELGLAGSENFSLKVSDDGANWREAMQVDRASGAVSLPQTKMLTGFYMNLYSDSGRFSGVSGTSLTVGAFVMPSYLTLYNSTSVLGLGKYIYNNTDYGGTGGTLNMYVKALVDMIRDPAFRRYGVEFWVAQVTAGSGTGGAITHLSQTYYLSLMSTQTVRAPQMTLHFYVRAIDQPIVIRCSAGQKITVDGVASEENTMISPSSNWVSVTIHDTVSPRENYGYLPMILNIFTRAAGNRYQFACPALIGGIIPVDDDSGIMASINTWAA